MRIGREPAAAEAVRGGPCDPETLGESSPAPVEMMYRPVERRNVVVQHAGSGALTLEDPRCRLGMTAPLRRMRYPLTGRSKLISYPAQKVSSAEPARVVHSSHGRAVVSAEIEQAVELFPTREEAEEMLGLVLEDEPGWQDVPRIEPLRLVTGLWN
jgi:hypothetical protein